MESSQYKNIPEEFDIPYGEYTHKRTFAQKCRKIKNTILADLAYSCHSAKWRIRFHKWRGVHIGEKVYIGIHCTLDNLYPELIYLEDGVSVNADSMILTHFNPHSTYKRIIKASASPVLIKRHSIIATRSTIMPGVMVGETAIVSAGSIVYEDVEDKTLVRGNPAKKIGRLRL